MMESSEKGFCLYRWMCRVSAVFLKNVLCSFLFCVQEEVCVYSLNIIMGQGVNVRLCELHDQTYQLCQWEITAKIKCRLQAWLSLQSCSFAGVAVLMCYPGKEQLTNVDAACSSPRQDC